MPLNQQDIQQVAELARIKLSSNQLTKTKVELNQILNLLERLSAIDTKGVAPMAHAQEVSLCMRTDQITEIDQSALFQTLAARTEKGLYLIPKVIE